MTSEIHKNSKNPTGFGEKSPTHSNIDTPINQKML